MCRWWSVKKKTIYGNGGLPIVAGRHYRHDYIGMEIFDAASGEEYDNIILQYQWELEEYLVARWRELPPKTIIRRLMELFS